MSASYETTIYCNQPEEILKEIMEEAVSQYLSSNPRAFSTEKEDRSIVLRIPVNFKSWGEKMTVSVQENAFHIISMGMISFQIIDWGRNRDNVRDMTFCLENAIRKLA